MVFWGRGEGGFILKNYHYLQKNTIKCPLDAALFRVTGQDLGGSWLVSDQLGGEMEDLGSGRIQAALEKDE